MTRSFWAWLTKRSHQQTTRDRCRPLVELLESRELLAVGFHPNYVLIPHGGATPFGSSGPTGYTPAQIRQAYGFNQISFNGVAQIRVAPTTDRSAVRDSIGNLKLGERTAIGEAIYASLEAINSAVGGKQADKVPARIVLLSDGETTTGRPDSQAAAEAKKQRVAVSTIAFGTDTGTIQLSGEPIPTPVRVNRDALRRISDATGGTALGSGTTV